MKKIFIIILVLIAVKATAQIDTIRNFQFFYKTGVTTCYYQLSKNAKAVNRIVANDSLQPELNILMSPFCTYYAIQGDTINRVLYQNKSEVSPFGDGYERAWVFYKNSQQKEVKLNDMPYDLQLKYYYLAEKLKKVIKGK